VNGTAGIFATYPPNNVSIVSWGKIFV
jgi:hypothetical protein